LVMQEFLMLLILGSNPSSALNILFASVGAESELDLLNRRHAGLIPAGGAF
jgi:hypothetical protein